VFEERVKSVERIWGRRRIRGLAVELAEVLAADGFDEPIGRVVEVVVARRDPVVAEVDRLLRGVIRLLRK